MVGSASSEDLPYVNGLCLIAIDPDALCGIKRFKELMDDLINYVTNSPPAPGFSEVVMPGTLDFRMRDKRIAEGIPLTEQTWRQIVDIGHRLGVEIKELST